MTKAEQIKQLMKEYGQLERQAKAAFKKTDEAHSKLWASADGSAEAKHWNAEWKKQEAIGVSFREKANKILDRVERLKEENPRYLVTAKQKTVRDVDLGILEDRSAVKAISRAKSLYAGKGYTGMKARRRNPVLTQSQIDALPFLQRNELENEMMRYRLRGEPVPPAVLNTDSTVSLGPHTWDKKGKYVGGESIFDRPKSDSLPKPKAVKTTRVKAERLPDISPGVLSQSDIQKLPFEQRNKVKNAQMSARLSGSKVKSVALNSDKTVSLFGSNEFGDYVLTYDRKGKLVNPTRRKNKTIIKAGRIDHLDVAKVHNPYKDLVIKGFAQKTPQGWKIGRKTIPQGKGIVNVSSGYKLDRATGTVFTTRARNPRNVSQGFFDGNGVFHPIRSSADYDSGRAGEGKGSAVKHPVSKKRREAMRKASRTAKDKASYRVPIAGDTRRPRKNVAQGFFDGNGVFHPIRSSSDYDGEKAGETGKKPIRTRSKKRKASLKKAGQTARLKAETKRRKSTTSRLASRSLSKSAGILKGSGSQRQKRNPWRTRYPELTGSEKQIAWAKSIRNSFVLNIARERKVWIDRLNRDPNLSAAEKKRMLGIYNRAMGQAIKEKSAKWWIDNKNMSPEDAARRLFREEYANDPRVRRNPSPAENRREFAGRYSGDKDLYFPEGTPNGLSKLGTLKLIKAEAGSIKPTKGTVWLCRDQAGKLHLGTTKANAILFSGSAQSLGEIKVIEYDEAKPHLGEHRTVRWFHKMGEDTGERPTLYADGKGGLKIRGGAYRIEARGIVN